MINGYLITVLIAAVPTFFAVVAPRRTPRLARMSFWLGIALNELPFYPVLWLMSSTALAALDGTLWRPTGIAAGVVAAATVAGLVVVLVRGASARRVLAHQLDCAGLVGAGTFVRDARSVARTIATVFVPFAVRVRGVRRVADIVYGGHERHRLDVYRSPSSASKSSASSPVLVYFHGGAYLSGRKDKESRLLMHRLADRGWLCVSANYRLRPAAGFDEHLADLGSVLTWVRAHAAEYGGDGTQVVLAGSSAGAHMASIAALLPDHSALPPAGSGPRVRAVIGLYGFYGHYYGFGPRRNPSSSPVDHVRAEAPPFFLVHGAHDTYVPVSGARDFAARLRAGSHDTVVYAELPGAQHSFDLFRSIRFDSVVDAVTAFLDEVAPSISR